MHVFSQDFSSRLFVSLAEDIHKNSFLDEHQRKIRKTWWAKDIQVSYLECRTQFHQRKLHLPCLATLFLSTMNIKLWKIRIFLFLDLFLPPCIMWFKSRKRNQPLQTLAARGEFLLDVIWLVCIVCQAFSFCFCFSASANETSILAMALLIISFTFGDIASELNFFSYSYIPRELEPRARFPLTDLTNPYQLQLC